MARPGVAVVPDQEMRLEISNGTTLPVTLVVNGVVVDTFPAGDGPAEGIPASELPPLPWDVEARSPTGRALVTLTVRSGDVWSADTSNGGREVHGAAVRVDLSCGRLDIWSGPPLMGPLPGPGIPGDCAP